MNTDNLDQSLIMNYNDEDTVNDENIRFYRIAKLCNVQSSKVAFFFIREKDDLENYWCWEMMEVIVIMMTIMIDGEYNVGYDNTIEQQKCLHFTPTHSHAWSHRAIKWLDVLLKMM